ncbi:hypothetical protein AB0M61_01815 [Streptomyces sp. NPDC051642]|uniref:hypothetical protein n=1 Tax=Streptomyces sp. NPDC051642 TaxID=3154646 RepID=UPI00342EEBF4
MARGHGRILTSIWDDADFLALDPQEQRLYLFLISQPNLNHAGLLDLTLRRWSRKARGLTSAELEKTLQALEAARFIVMDDDTEELLIRSFIRNDGVWKQPKVMGAMVSGALEISSWRLRNALLAEMDRIPLDELSDEPGARGPSIRQQVSEQIGILRKAFGSPPPDPTGGGSVTPSGTPSDTPPEEDAEERPKASTRGRAPASRAHSPAPAPAPAPNPSPVKEGGGRGIDHSRPESTVEHQRPDDRPAPIDDAGFELNDGMRRWAHRDGYAALVDIDYETAQFVSHHRAERTHKRSWPDEWQKWIRRSAKWASERSNNVVLLQPRPSTTDARVQAALDLGRQMQAEHDAAHQEAQ